MCGINGILSLKVANKPEIVHRMNQKLIHRGPDAGNVYNSDEISLGHRRLSIIDLSDQGNQPMSSDDGRFIIVYNGELYNFKEIKSQIKDYNFKTETDTEVILASYIMYGEDCIKDFNGMFAFAIWDNFSKNLFVVRDRMGIKPLYYFHNDEKFIFSSEIRALLESDGIKRKLDPDAVVDYLQYQTVHAPNTIIEGVKMLMPGHSLNVNENIITIKKYWNLGDKSSELVTNKEEAKSKINSLLTDAVESRLVADVPFGAFLSGGIDSSIIVGLMSKVSQSKINTFSITFKEQEFTEEKYSTLIARKFNTEHHKIELSVNHFLNELPNALAAMDHPSGDGPNTYIVSKATKAAGITMALSGLGGDEIFAGYDIFKRSYSLLNNSIIQKSPMLFRKLFGSVLSTVKPGVSSNKIKEILNLNEISLQKFYPINRKLWSDVELHKLINYKNNIENQVERILKNQLNPNLPILSQVSVAEISTYMQNVLLRDSDQMSMASALEVRVPFLDHRLVEYVLNISDDVKYPRTPKQLLVESVQDILPPEIVNRPKMGFTLPWNHWMKNELKDFCESRLSNFTQRDFVHNKQVELLWARFLSGDKKVNWSRIWGIVVLENWLQENRIE